jgi:hypothetical protein
MAEGQYGDGGGSEQTPDFWAQNAPPAQPPSAAPGAAGTPPAAPGRLSDAEFQQWFQQATGGQPPTPAVLKSMEAEIVARGGKLRPNAAGVVGKLETPGGTIADVIQGAGTGGQAWQWLTGDGGGDQGRGGMAGFGSGPGTYQSSPFAGSYQAPQTPSWLSSPYVASTWQGGDFSAPEKSAALKTPFAAPTQAELESSAGYQSRLAAGQQARDRSAAAQGSVLSGGTQKALSRYGQDYASNEYQNLFGQNLATRGQNVGEYQQDYGNAFGAYQQRYGQFMDAENNQFRARQQNAGEFGQQQQAAQQTYQNQYGQYLGDESRKLNDFLTNYGVQHTSETDYWNRLNDVANRGASAGGYGG